SSTAEQGTHNPNRPFSLSVHCCPNLFVDIIVASIPSSPCVRQFPPLSSPLATIWLQGGQVGKAGCLRLPQLWLSTSLLSSRSASQRRLVPPVGSSKKKPRVASSSASAQPPLNRATPVRWPSTAMHGDVSASIPRAGLWEHPQMHVYARHGSVPLSIHRAQRR